jgi:PEP-CTERM motif-containing protein
LTLLQASITLSPTDHEPARLQFVSPAARPSTLGHLTQHAHTRISRDRPAFRLAGTGLNTGGSLRNVALIDAPPPPVVPEPTTLLLCTTGLAFAGYRRRMMRNSRD